MLFSCTVALAGDAVIWNGSYGKFLPQLGLKLSDSKEYRTISVDPSAGGGVAANIGSVAVRDNAGTGEAWFKASAADTAWTNILTGLTGWSLVGNTGTNDAINFLGTTDAQDLVFRSNNVERMRINSDGYTQMFPDQLAIQGNIGVVAGTHNGVQLNQNYTGTVGGSVNALIVQPNFADAVSGNYSGITENSVWANGSSAGSYLGTNISPTFQTGSAVVNPILINTNANIQSGSLAGQNMTVLNMNPNVDSNMAGMNTANSSPSISTTLGYYNGYNESSQWAATSQMTSNAKMFNSSPNIAAGATFNSATGYFSGANVAAGVTINDWTDFQASPTIDSNMSSYTGQAINPQGSGDFTNVTLSSLSPNLTGDHTSVTGYSLNGTIGNNVTNYAGINISPSASGTVSSVTGINVNNSSITSTTPKAGLVTNDGFISIGSSYNTATYGANFGVSGINFLGGTFTVDSGTPVTGGSAVIANNLATVTQFDDDMPVDLLGGLIGYTYVGLVGQTNIAATKTVDHINFMMAGSGVSATSGGGAVTTVDFYKAAGF